MVVIKIQSNGLSISIFIFIALLFQTENDHLDRVTKVAGLRTDVGYLSLQLNFGSLLHSSHL